MAEHYFVVCYNTREKSWFVDDNLLGDLFPDGAICEGTTWRFPNDEAEGDFDWELSVSVAELLNKRVANA